MEYLEAIAYLTKCAADNGTHWYQGRAWSDVETCPTCHGTNDAGWLRCPGSRYGYQSRDCAEVAWKVARIEGDTDEYNLDRIMGLAVNDHDYPQEAMRQYAIGLSGADVEEIVDGYLEAQLWAGLDNERDDVNPPPWDENYGREDLAPEYVEAVTEEMTEFVAAHPLAVRMYLNARSFDPSYGSVSSYFGHDFLLTRDHHGVGFWDRGLGELGEYLTNLTRPYGSSDDLWDNGSGVLTA